MGDSGKIRDVRSSCWVSGGWFCKHNVSGKISLVAITPLSNSYHSCDWCHGLWISSLWGGEKNVSGLLPLLLHLQAQHHFWKCIVNELEQLTLTDVTGKINHNVVHLLLLFWKKIFIHLAVPGFHCSMQDLVPWPVTEPRPPALGAQSLSHWTTRELPNIIYPSMSFSWMI